MYLSSMATQATASDERLIILLIFGKFYPDRQRPLLASTAICNGKENQPSVVLELNHEWLIQDLRRSEYSYESFNVQ